MSKCQCGCNQIVNSKFIRGHNNKLRIGKKIEELYGLKKATQLKKTLHKPHKKRNISFITLSKERKFREKNKDRLYIYAHNWRIENREANKQYKIYKRKDIEFKLLETIRVRIGKALQNNTKGDKTRSLLGCSISEYKIFLEKQFDKRMNWSNHTKVGWHIHHKKSKCHFNLNKLEGQKKFFHYSNTEPKWHDEHYQIKDN